MLSFLTRLAVRRSSVTLLLTAAILVFGVFAATQLKQELIPSIDFPVITVITTYPGAESQTVADSISAPVEQAVSGLPRPAKCAIYLRQRRLDCRGQL